MSMSRTHVVVGATGTVTFVDHRVRFRPSVTTRFPSSEEMETTPEVSLMGESLLATQTTVWIGILSYHIPT